MKSKTYKLYRDAKRRGNREEAAELRYRLEQSARTFVSKYTKNKAWLARPVSVAARLLESKKFKQHLSEVIRAFFPEDASVPKRRLRRLNRDVRFTEFQYRMSPEEYFRYRFENLSKYGRQTYVGDIELNEAFRRLSDPEERGIIIDKYKTYCFFEPYFHRKAILVNGEADRAKLREFCEENDVFFVKPLLQYGGQGVCRIVLERDGSLEQRLTELLSSAPMIVEQPIRQAEAMACFHPQSINTIRVVSARIDGRTEIVQTSVRLGTGGSVVDNGCLSASVDPELGIITSPGREAYSSGLFIRHPDTGEQILGRQIPDWDKLLALVMELTSHLKRQRIVGWDLAYSTEGWVMVEANSQPAIQILAGNGVGMRDVFARMIR